MEQGQKGHLPRRRQRRFRFIEKEDGAFARFEPVLEEAEKCLAVTHRMQVAFAVAP